MTYSNDCTALIASENGWAVNDNAVPVVKVPTFEQCLAAFLAEASKLANANELGGQRKPGDVNYVKISAMVGRKYIRVVRTVAGDSRSVFCFVDRETGAVLKAASWKKPAKHARGNVRVPTNYGINAYGAHYLAR